MLKFLLILAYYDRPRIVRNALNSIANLQSDNWELAVIDDGSPRPVKPIATRILKRFRKRIKFFNTRQTVEQKNLQGGSIFGKYINQAMDESDADLVMLVCDDDAIVSDALINLSNWFVSHPQAGYCYSHVIPFDPLTETPGPNLPKRPHHTNVLGEIQPSCIVDSSQVVFKKTCHDQGGVSYPWPLTANLDMHVFSQLLEKYGLAPFSGHYVQYKGWFADQLGRRGGDIYVTRDVKPKKQPRCVKTYSPLMPRSAAKRKRLIGDMKKTRNNPLSSRAKLGILFLHHTCDEVTLNNLRSIQRHNPKATVVTMSADEPLPGGYTLNSTPKLRRLHSELPQRREDLLVCSWFLQRKERCEKWWIVEWDLFCEIPIFEYYKPVWNFPFVASSVCLLNREPTWTWFKAIEGTPPDYQPYLMGVVPFVFLMSEIALASTCRMLNKRPFFSGNSELRFATAANRSGYRPCGFSPPDDCITWIPWRRLVGPRNIFHPVKHYVDYR